MQVLNITHQDLDGCGCNVIIRKAFGNAVETRFVNYDTIDEELANLNPEEYSMVFITDILSAKQYDRLASTDNVFIIDHHIRPEIGEADTANVLIRKDKCATELTYDTLKGELSDSEREDLAEFARLVGIVDLFKREDPDWDRAQAMSDICAIYPDDNLKSLEYASDRFVAQTGLEPISEFEYDSLLAKRKDLERQWEEIRGKLFDLGHNGAGVRLNKNNQYFTINVLYEMGKSWLFTVREPDEKGVIYISVYSHEDFKPDFAKILHSINDAWGGHPHACGGQVKDYKEAAETLAKIEEMLTDGDYEEIE